VEISIDASPQICAAQYEWHGWCSGVFGARVSRYGACAKFSATSHRNLEGGIMQSTIEQIACSKIARTARGILFRNIPRLLLAAGLFGITVPFAHAGAELKISDDASVNLGLGLRTSFTSLENGAPDGKSYSRNFAVENARLYVGGKFAKNLKATFNTERTGGPAAAGGDSVRVLDAIVQLESNDLFNLWLGRMLPPSDRANLSGPFYVSAWSFPGVVSNYTNLAVGRDNGILVWGKPASGKLVYSVGAFNGHNRAAGLSNAANNVLYAGRLAVALWDSEPAPAYYEGGTYYGSKDIFTVGLAGQMQKDGAGTAAAKGNFKVWSLDALIEKKLGGGFVPALEGAYYKYDLGGVVDCGSGEPGSVACPVADNVGGQVAGKAFLLSGALLLPGKVSGGQIQPFIRYQKFDRDLSSTTSKATDFGVNYLLNGSNGKISLAYTKFDDSRLAPAQTSRKQIVLGLQVQY
jgi:hypothetical protein